MRKLSSSWYDRAKAAVSEGFCPEHERPLGEAGWCPDCGADGCWWRWDPATQSVVTSYRHPERFPGWPYGEGR